MSIAQGALAEAFRFDLERATPFSGALRALPVIALVAIGLSTGSDQAALTLGLGANLVAIASIVATRRLRVPLATFIVIGLASATFVGSVTAGNTPVHLVVLSIWCFFTGLLVVFGLGPSTAGIQSVIAFVVFGRFPDSVDHALGLGALVAGGAFVEAAVLLVLRLPPTLRAQRSALATAFRLLADLAGGSGVSALLASAEAFDRAAVILGTTALFGRTDAQSLRSLIDEGRRMRLELAGLTGLQDRLDQREQPADRDVVNETVAEAAGSIRAVADAIDRRAPLLAVQRTALALGRAIEVARATTEPTGGAKPALSQSLVHLEALAGQIRAAIKLLIAPDAVERDDAGPSNMRTKTSELKATVLGDLQLIRASLRLGSSTFRHAVRLAIAVPGAALVAEALNLPRGYWVTFTVAAVLRPDYSSLFRRGIARVVGTIIGATLAALIVGGLHPDATAIVLLVAVTAWGAYSLWQASFSVATAFITALVLVLLSTTQVDSISTALDRLIDTVVGGTIALAIYVAWPTWSNEDAVHSLARLVRAQRSYLVATCAVATGDITENAEVATNARAARLAWAEAESTIGKSMDEPERHRIDPEFSSGCLAACRRIVQTVHALRVETARGLTVRPSAETMTLINAFGKCLDMVAARLDDPQRPGEDCALRRLYTACVARLVANGSPAVIALHFDELVDAINTLSAIVADHALAGARASDR